VMALPVYLCLFRRAGCFHAGRETLHPEFARKIVIEDLKY